MYVTHTHTHARTHARTHTHTHLHYISLLVARIHVLSQSSEVNFEPQMYESFSVKISLSFFSVPQHQKSFEPHEVFLLPSKNNVSLSPLPNRSVMREHSVWQESEWRMVECHEVEETTQSQLASLQALPLFTHSWDLHQHLASFLLATQVGTACLL